MRGLLGVALVLLALAPIGARAQDVSVTFSTLQTNTQNPTLADFASGYVVDATSAGFTLAGSNALRNSCTYSTKLQLRASTASMGNSKPISDVEWRVGSGSWNVLSTTYADVATAALTKGQSSSGTLTFRTKLAWTDDAASYLSAQLQFQIIVTPSGSGCT